MESAETPIQRCKRCASMEELAEGFRLALVESAKLIEYILHPETTDAQRAELRRQAFGPEDASQPPSDVGDHV